MEFLTLKSKDRSRKSQLIEPTGRLEAPGSGMWTLTTSSSSMKENVEIVASVGATSSFVTAFRSGIWTFRCAEGEEQSKSREG
eukprot:scaffold44926_cov36-Tisochrysis_lutea.AAC.1